MGIAVIFIPPKPFLLYGAGTFPSFNNLINNLPPFHAGTPNGSAAGPDKNVTTPSLKPLCPSALLMPTKVNKEIKIDDIKIRHCLKKFIVFLQS